MSDSCKSCPGKCESISATIDTFDEQSLTKTTLQVPTEQMWFDLFTNIHFELKRIADRIYLWKG